MHFQGALGVLQQFAVVADQQQPAARRAPGPHLVDEEAPPFAVQVVAGFVQHQQAGLAAEGADQGQQGALAAGQRLRRHGLVQPGLVQHRLPARFEVPAFADQVEVLIARVASRQPPQRLQRRIESGQLRQGGGEGGAGLLFDVTAGDDALDTAACRLRKSGDDAAERGLAAAVGADQGDGLGFEAVVDVLEQDAPVGEGDVDPVQGQVVGMGHEYSL